MRSNAAVLSLLILVVGSIAGYAAVPSMMSYQGRVTDDNGKPLPDDFYPMVFRLYDSATGGKLLWQEPEKEALKVSVTRGLFTVLLGSTVPIPEEAFEGETWLETEIDGKILSPRSRIVSSGYAFRAGIADAVPGGSVTASQIASGQVVKSINGLKDDVTLASGENITITPSGNTLTLSSSGGSGWSLQGNSGTTPGTDFLGTRDTKALEIKVNNERALRLEPVFTDSGRIGVYNYGVNIIGGLQANSVDSGVLGATISGGGAGTWDDWMQEWSFEPNQVTDDFGVVAGGHSNTAGDSAGATSDRIGATVSGGILNSAEGAYSTVPGGSDNTAAGYYSFAAGRRAKALHSGAFVWGGSVNSDFSSTGTGQFLIRAPGGVGVGINDPAYPLDVEGTVRSRSGGFRFPDGSVQTTAGDLHLPYSGSMYTTLNAFSITNTGTGNTAVFKQQNSSTAKSAVYAESASSGAAVYAKHTGSSAYAEAGTDRDGVFASTPVASGRGVYGQSTGSSGYGVYALAAGTNGTGLYARGNYDGKAAIFRGNVQIQSYSTGSVVMELGEGLDYAEGFDVSDGPEVGPGTVLAIDPNNPGQLKVAAEAYDTKVAGIVAGANGLGSGVRLGAGDFDHDVALAGRVYCNVDATQAAVKPGDLLTTSATPGYAMKVTDHQRAQGAILGKAMESLEKGHRAKILVLVTLQ